MYFKLLLIFKVRVDTKAMLGEAVFHLEEKGHTHTGGELPRELLVQLEAAKLLLFQRNWRCGCVLEMP